MSAVIINFAAAKKKRERRRDPFEVWTMEDWFNFWFGWGLK